MFKISIFDGNMFSLPRREFYKLLKQSGFDSMMLGWRDDNRIENLYNTRNAGLLIENIHAPFNNADSIWLDNLNGDDYMECLLTSIEDCREFDIPTMVVHLLNEHNSPPPSNIGIERLKRVAEKAEHDNINIAFENTYAPDLIQFTFDNIPSKKLGFCFDSGHQHCMTPDRDLLEEFGNRLMAMHLHDNFGAGENPMYGLEWARKFDLHLLPFDGNIDWNKITQQLKKVKYKGAIAFEVHNFKSEYTPEEYYETAFKRAKKLSDMINK